MQKVSEPLILEMDVLEAVIGLGANLFYGTGLAACILVLRARKKPERKGQVLFVDASRLFKRGRNQNTLEAQQTEEILEIYRGYKTVEGKAKLATLDEIEGNDWNLNIPRYVEPIAQAETMTVDEAVSNLKQSLNEAYTAEDRLRGLLKEAGISG